LFWRSIAAGASLDFVSVEGVGAEAAIREGGYALALDAIEARRRRGGGGGGGGRGAGSGGAGGGAVGGDDAK
jgi:hypothetical protein